MNTKNTHFADQVMSKRIERFDGGQRLNANELWNEYTNEKQTVKQLSKSHACSERTIHRYLASADKKEKSAEHKNVNAIMDTAYFQREWSVIVLRDSINSEFWVINQ